MRGLSRFAYLALVATLGCEGQGVSNSPSPPRASEANRPGDVSALGSTESEAPSPQFTETPPAPGKPVTPAIAFTRNPGGSDGHIWVRLKIASGFHVYGKIERKSAYQPLTIELKLPDGTTATGDWDYPAAGKSNGHPAYFDSVVLKQPLNIGLEKGQITAVVRYQACNDEVCFPPATAEMTVSLD